MPKRIVSILVLCASLGGYAMQPQATNPFNTYGGCEINPETVGLIPSQVPGMQLPELDGRIIRKWIHDNDTIIKSLVETSYPLLCYPLACILPDASMIGSTIRLTYFFPNFGVYNAVVNACLNQYGKDVAKRLQLEKYGIKKSPFQNLSKAFNYIFEIQGTKYVTQISGRLSRVHNLLIANHFPHDRVPDQLCEALIRDKVPTYQTVSRFAGYLRAYEANSKFHLDKVKLPRTYLIGLYEDSPELVNDDNSIIIQEKVADEIGNLNLFLNARNEAQKEKKEKILILVASLNQDQKALLISPEHVRQIAILAISSSLWDMHDNLLFDADSREFVYTDFEQPDNSNPTEFYLKNEAIALNLSRIARDQVCGLFGGVPGLGAICKILSQLTEAELKQIASGTLPASIATPLK